MTTVPKELIYLFMIASFLVVILCLIACSVWGKSQYLKGRSDSCEKFIKDNS